MERSIQTQIEATTLEIATCSNRIDDVQTKFDNAETAIGKLSLEQNPTEQQQQQLAVLQKQFDVLQKQLDRLWDREKGLRAKELKLLETQGLLAANTTGAPLLSRCRSVLYPLSSTATNRAATFISSLQHTHSFSLTVTLLPSPC